MSPHPHLHPFIPLSFSHFPSSFTTKHPSLPISLCLLNCPIVCDLAERETSRLHPLYVPVRRRDPSQKPPFPRLLLYLPRSLTIHGYPDPMELIGLMGTDRSFFLLVLFGRLLLFVLSAFTFISAGKHIAQLFRRGPLVPTPFGISARNHSSLAPSRSCSRLPIMQEKGDRRVGISR